MTSNLGLDQIVFWHRELPPPTAEVVGEGEVEANSQLVPGTLANRDRLCEECLADVMSEARIRLEQEVRRRGGRYAHGLSEGLDVKRNDANGETWLHGRFAYVMLA